jgi:hypothetical protein
MYLNLEINCKYVLIDALYINNIKKRIKDIDPNLLIEDYKNIIFPYARFPYAIYNNTSTTFEISRIKRNNYEFDDSNSAIFLDSDTGILIIIKENQLLNFAEKFDFGKLVDSDDLVNLNYWEEITQDYLETDIGLIAHQLGRNQTDLSGGGEYMVML